MSAAKKPTPQQLAAIWPALGGVFFVDHAGVHRIRQALPKTKKPRVIFYDDKWTRQDALTLIEAEGHTGCNALLRHVSTLGPANTSEP